MSTTLLDEVLAAVDAGTEPAPTALQDWVHRLPDPTAAAQEIAGVRRRVLALRPRAAEQVEAALGLALETALRHATERAVDAALDDAVTGLPTRRIFERDARRALAAAGRSGRPLSVVMVDVDGLKQVNDLQGHAAGDAHLRAVADALRAVVRQGDGAYRIGGDEFVLLLPDADRAAAERVLLRLDGPPVSWGVACADEGGDADALLAAADLRMYRARQARRGTLPAPRPRSRVPAWAVLAAALATAGTGALVTTTSSSSPRDAAPAGAPPALTAPAAPAPVVPQPAAQTAAPQPAAPAPPVVVVRTVVLEAPATMPSRPPVPVPSPPQALPALPGVLPPLPDAAPAPPQDAGAVTVVVEETTELLDETLCTLLCRRG